MRKVGRKERDDVPRDAMRLIDMYGSASANASLKRMHDSWGGFPEATSANECNYCGQIGIADERCIQDTDKIMLSCSLCKMSWHLGFGS